MTHTHRQTGKGLVLALVRYLTDANRTGWDRSDTLARNGCSSSMLVCGPAMSLRYVST